MHPTGSQSTSGCFVLGIINQTKCYLCLNLTRAQRYEKREMENLLMLNLSYLFCRNVQTFSSYLFVFLNSRCWLMISFPYIYFKGRPSANTPHTLPLCHSLLLADMTAVQWWVLLSCRWKVSPNFLSESCCFFKVPWNDTLFPLNWRLLNFLHIHFLTDLILTDGLGGAHHMAPSVK